MDRQSDAAEAWCKANGQELNESLRLDDAGISAFKGAHLKGALGKFLRLAELGDLGDDPILLVEAIDRLSRLEAVDGLQDVLLALVKTGVRIVSLEDGQEYSRSSLREDGTKLVMLALKAQAAHEYSKRLSKRITAAWKQDEDDLVRGILPRKKFFCPPWCRLNGDEFELIDNKVEAVLKVFEYSRLDGVLAVSKRLNEEGIPGLVGGVWTASKVRRLLNDARVWGAIRLGQMDRYSKEVRERMQAEGKETRDFPGFLPVILSKEEVDLVVAHRTTRTRTGSDSHLGRKEQTWNVASGFTRCTCGAAASLATTYSNSTKRDGGGKKIHLRYARCVARCGAPGYRMEELNGHLLARLTQGQIQQLLADDSRDGEIKAERDAIQRLQAQLIQAEQAQNNASEIFKAELKKGKVDRLYKEAVDEARDEAELSRTALISAQQRLAGLTHEVDSVEFDAALKELWDAFVKGEDTPAQRKSINRFLQGAGVRVTLDAQTKRVGMGIGGSDPVWMPLDPNNFHRIVMSMGGWGMTENGFENSDPPLTDDDIEPTTDEDWEELQELASSTNKTARKKKINT